MNKFSQSFEGQRKFGSKIAHFEENRERSRTNWKLEMRAVKLTLHRIRKFIRRITKVDQALSWFERKACLERTSNVKHS